MTLRALYEEGLSQRALRGHDQLNTYKIGLIEAILRETLGDKDTNDVAGLRASIHTALEVARWEPR